MAAINQGNGFIDLCTINTREAVVKEIAISSNLAMKIFSHWMYAWDRFSLNQSLRDMDI